MFPPKKWSQKEEALEKQKKVAREISQHYFFPPIIMASGKFDPLKMSLVSKGAIFHFQDCWKKSFKKWTD